MKITLNSSVLFALIFMLGISQAKSQDAEFDKHTIRIKFKSEDRAVLKENLAAHSGVSGVTSIDELNSKHGVKNIRPLFPATRPSLQAKHEKYGIDLWYVVELEDDVNDVLIDEYTFDKHVLKAEPVYKAIDFGAAPLGTLDAATDPDYDEQWSLYNTNKDLPDEIDYVGREDIDMEPAWDIETGDEDVIVAVIESGAIDYDHEDLADAMWINEAEANGTSGVDDDGNGYIDDIYGLGFAAEGGTFQLYPDDHATAVGGIIGAVRNNGIGIAGIAGGDGSGNGVRLMSCQNDLGTNNSDKAAAIVYAADNGAVIANLSWGFSSSSDFGQSLQDAIDYFTATAGTDDYGTQVGPMNGGLIVAAAGNSGYATEVYPASYEPVIAVAATNLYDERSLIASSNFGDWVDISAPGQYIYSTENDDDYGSNTGTSFASPIVAGVAALIVSKYKNEGITPDLVREALLNSADPITSGTYPSLMGSGRVDAYNALTYSLSLACSPETYGNGGNAYSLGDQIEGEHFNQCGSGQSGNGVTYYESDAGQSGNTSIRPGETVDLFSKSINGSTVQGIGWTSSGEYWTYTVDIPSSSSSQELQVDLNVATSYSNREVEIEIGGITTTATFSSFGGWESFDVVSQTITLPSSVSGEQIMKITTVNGGMDLDWLSIGGITNLPSPWQTADIGSVSAAGSASESSGTFTVQGSGADIWGTSDEFRYVYQTLDGDGEIIAQVNSLTNTNSWAKAGVMIRESLTANSAHASSVVTPSNGVSYQRRTSTGSGSAHNTVSGQSAPEWLRMVRSGNSFSAYYSADGSNWTQMGSAVTISMSSSVYVGLCLTSHNDGTLTTATYSNVSISTGGNATPEGNLALLGTAEQSTTAYNGSADRANDDDTSGVWSDGSVTHTQAGVGQWWKVDLGATYSIGEIVIWNRTNCCMNRLDDITVTVENSSENVLWSQNITSSSATTLTVDAGGVSGQVVRITQNQAQALSLAEVQVYGSGTSSSTFPDVTKTYYIDCPVHNLRLAATGESEDAYTTSTSTTGADVEWQFVQHSSGNWHIQRAAGGSMPRLRTDNTLYADMQSTSFSGSYTYYELTEGVSSDTYFLTLPDGPSSYQRLQMYYTGEMRFVTTASAGTWESFSFTEAGSASREGLNENLMNENLNASTISVYPNPVTNQLTISGVDHGKLINVTNIHGATIMSQKSNQFDVSSLKPGIYFVKVQNNEMVRFIKQ